MANETSTSSLPISTEEISALVLDALYPSVVVADLVGRDTLPPNRGKVWQQYKFPAITAASVGETSDITAATRTPTREANITVAEVGVNTAITDLSRETALASAADIARWAQQSGQAIAQKIEGDLCALFATLNSSTAVGSTGTNISVANFLSAMYALELVNVDISRAVCVLHPVQKYDLAGDLASTSNAGALHTNIAELIRNGTLANGPRGPVTNGLWGTLFGVPVYSTSEVDTANSAADRAGAMFTPEAMALIQLRPLRVEYDRDASTRITEIVATVAYGVGENDEARGIPIITDA